MKAKLREYDIDEKENSLNRSTSDVSSLLQKYDQEREKQLKKSNRRLIASELKRVKSPTKDYFTCEDGLITRLSNKIDNLSEELADKNYKLRETTAELFNWKQKYNELILKFEKCQEKKQLLKEYLKEKVEANVSVEENLSYSQEIINELNRSIREIQSENINLSKLKNENMELNRKMKEFEELKQNFMKLQMKYSNIKKASKMESSKKHLKTLIKSKLMAFKNELSFIKSSFQSELSILKSSMESAFSNLTLKHKEIIMNLQFTTEKCIMNYKQQLLEDHSTSDCCLKLKESTIKLNSSQNEISTLSEQIKKYEQELNSKKEQIKDINKQLEFHIENKDREMKENSMNLVNIMRKEFDSQITH